MGKKNGQKKRVVSDDHTQEEMLTSKTTLTTKTTCFCFLLPLSVSKSWQKSLPFKNLPY